MTSAAVAASMVASKDEEPLTTCAVAHESLPVSGGQPSSGVPSQSWSTPSSQTSGTARQAFGSSSIRTGTVVTLLVASASRMRPSGFTATCRT